MDVNLHFRSTLLHARFRIHIEYIYLLGLEKVAAKYSSLEIHKQYLNFVLLRWIFT